MPKLDKKITDAVVRGLEAPTKGNALYYDPELPGFAARVTAAGARSFILSYYFERAERRDTIGQFPAWSASAARKVAKAWRRDADLGIDPRGEVEPAEADKMLFKPLAEQFLAHGKTKRGRDLEPATKREYRRALLVYAEPLHDRAVTDVRRSEIQTLIDTIAKKHGEVTAMRARAALSRFFNWLLPRVDDLSNPVQGTEGYSTPKGQRVLSSAELAALWAATAESTDFHLIVRIMLWTGARRSEIGSLKWSEIVDGELRIPGSRTKNHRPLVLPMPRQMCAALEAWPRRLGRDYLFGSGAHGFQGWSQSKRRLDARLGDEPFDLHDIRRSVETRMAGLGILKDHVNRVLNHAVGPITEAYDRHSYTPEKSAALQKWANELERIVGQPAEVVPLRRKVS